nr:MAG TPA: tail protein [Caudoviricetes sp.]
MKDELSDGVSVVTYSGRSWHGMLAGKVLQPDSGQDYLKVSGPVNQVLSNLLARIGLSDVFKVRADSTKTIPTFQFDRYCTAYDGIRRMLAANDLKLMFQEVDGTVWMYAQPIVAHDDTVDSDLVDFSITKDYRRTNHMIGLGKGDLRNRLVVHYYADGSGKVSSTRTFGGRDEIAAVYDYSSAEKDELDKQTKKQLQDLQGAGAVDVTVHDGLSLDVGDRVAGCDHVTGLTVTAVVLKKIVKLSGGLLSVSYEVGDAASSKTEYSNYTSSSSSSSSGSTGGGVSLTAGRGLSISGSTINAEVASEDLDAVRQVAESANKTASGFAAQIGKANQTAEDAKNVADAAKSVADSAKSGMMTDSERSKLASVERGANAYTLPKASTDVLGGVRVDGSSIVSVDGVISAHVGDGASGRIGFPIGYVVQNTTGIDPSVDFGGTWRQLPSLGCFTFERIG